MLGKVSVAAAAELRANGDYFAKLIQRVVPKSYAQAMAEVEVTATFLENFGGDNVRQLGRGFCVPGDHAGQQSVGYRWPFGPVAVISPFNFPLEIPVLQLMGALYMGNRPTLKPDTRVAVVMEQFMRMLIHCGLPATDVDMLCADGPTTGRFVRSAKPRSVQFTGSSRAAGMWRGAAAHSALAHACKLVAVQAWRPPLALNTCNSLALLLCFSRDGREGHSR